MKVIKKISLTILVLFVVVLGVGAYLYIGTKTTNPYGYKCIGDIPAPIGYHRMYGNDGFATYLRSLPLHERGHKIQLYTGGDARLQVLGYAVIDFPLLSNAEQCADACMRLRAEYLYNIGRYSEIHFRDVNGRNMRYQGGVSRSAFERYLRNVYGVASTFSLSRELETRPLRDIQPGDVFVYAGVDRGHKMGHAIMVVDVAENMFGNKVFMLAEGNTPAREFHILRNWFNPFRSAWFSLDENAETLMLSPFKYKKNELKHW